MITGNKKYSDLPAPAYIDVVNHIDGTNEDIISVLENNFRSSAAQAKKFAARFKGSSRKETAFNVWKFLKDNVRYKADGKRQKIKYISRLLADGVGDCKSFTLAEASILKHFMPIGFRYVSYNNSRTPSHVYLIAKDENGNVFPVDAVWYEFGSEKSFTHKIDNWMTVESLTGIESVFTQDEIRMLRHRIKRLLQKRNEHREGSESWQQITQRARKLYQALKNDDRSILVSIDGIQDRAKRKAKRAERKASGKGSGVKKIALAPGRAAFLAMVNLNVRGLAKKLSTIPAIAQAKWKKLGGNPDKLMKAIEKGKKKKAFLGESKKNKALKGIGEPITLGALLIAAAPVLVAIASILPKGTEKGEPGTSTEDLLSATEEAGGDTSFNADSTDVEITDKGKGKDHSGGLLDSIPTPVLYVGGAVAAYFGAKALKIIK